MKKRKTYLLRAALVLLAAALVLTAALSGVGLKTGEPAPLPQTQAEPIRAEGQGQRAEQPDDPEEKDEPEKKDEPEQPQNPDEPQDPEQPDETEPPADPGEEVEPDAPKQDDGPADDTPGGSKPAPGPADDTSPQIVTDLTSGEKTYAELTDDILPFYAYLINAEGQTLKVRLRNSRTPQNGTYLTADGRDYQARLCRGETNYITMYRKSGTKTLQEVNFAIRYTAQKADEQHQTIGSNPPTIITNIENGEEIRNRNLTLTVQAVDYNNRNLPESHIQVYLDGKQQFNPTGGPNYEYQMYFQNPFAGDSEDHIISIRAWDDEENSRYVSYRITYLFTDTGDVTGSATIILDGTTVGLDIMQEAYICQVRQNVPASYAVLEALEEWGYDYEYGGSPDTGFYLRRISQAGMMDVPAIPENLWAKILQDGLTLTGQHDPDSLGEFDFTQGSGWMYSVGGETYAGKGLSNYYLSPGDTLYLRFTLAYGKDIGGYEAAGSHYGALPTYCGRWINGKYIDQHQWGEPQQTAAPDCTHPGEMTVTCTVCGDVGERQDIPALGHDFVEAERRDGTVVYICSRCGERKEEPAP